MPLNPASWRANAPVTAKALNTALYEYQPGNRSTPTGILFHGVRPVLVEGASNISFSQASAVNGAYTSMSSSDAWHNYYDAAAFFDLGMDQSGASAAGAWVPRVSGSSGIAGNISGNWLMIGSPSWAAMDSTATACGASILTGASTTLDGGKQNGSNIFHNAPYVVDLLNPASPSVFTQMQGWCWDNSAASFAYDLNAGDYSGRVCRMYTMWAGNSSNTITTGTLPVPFNGYTATTAITSAFLNGSTGINGPLQLLNSPPMLRVARAPGGSVTAGTAVTVPLSSTPDIDNYSDFNTGTRTYTVPLNGVYLVHGVVTYDNTSNGPLRAGFNVNGTLNVWGPASASSATTNIAPSCTRLLDLHAGDTIQLVAWAASGGNNFSNTFTSKLVMLWMGSLGTPPVLWSVPDVNYRWQAGTPGSQLPGLFQSRIANDLGFLVQRPYLLTWQQTPQTGLGNAVFQTITMDQVNGRIHGSTGDPYGGWTSGASNVYTVQQAGWYLVVGGYLQNASSTAFQCIAGVNQSPSGNFSPDWHQSQYGAVSSSIPPGAEAIGLYYLRVNDTIQPQYEQGSGDPTFNTTDSSVFTGAECHFGCIWVSS